MCDQTIISERCLELLEYSTLDDTEFGRVSTALVDMWYQRGYLSDPTTHAIEIEILENLNWYKDNMRIVRTTETITRPVSNLEFV